MKKTLIPILAATLCASAAQAEKPNVLFVIADDLMKQVELYDNTDITELARVFTGLSWQGAGFNVPLAKSPGPFGFGPEESSGDLSDLLVFQESPDQLSPGVFIRRASFR